MLQFLYCKSVFENGSCVLNSVRQSLFAHFVCIFLDILETYFVFLFLVISKFVQFIQVKMFCKRECSRMRLFVLF